MNPRVSFVVPAQNEETQLPSTLDSIKEQRTEIPYEIMVVDGASEDQTPAIARNADVQVIEGEGRGVGRDRNIGANHAEGDWLAFVDADTLVDPLYLNAMHDFVTTEDLVAATSNYRFAGERGRRERFIERTHYLFLLYSFYGPAILYGFNTFVNREAFAAVNGFPEVPNEDIAFSHRIASQGLTAVHPEKLVQASPRRVDEHGMTGTLFRYLRRELNRRRA